MNTLSQAVEKALDGEGRSRELAHAKINLALHVTGRRPDGYHNIETLAVFTDYGDVVSGTASSSGGMALGIDGIFADTLTSEAEQHDNLVVRAAEALAHHAGKKARPARLRLNKRIPIAAGLGGGSADAAATLRLLNRHWQLGLSNQALTEIGAPLGADIPMCVGSRPVIATGIGQKLSSAGAIPALPVVLAYPGGGMLTQAVYASLEKVDGSGLPALPSGFASHMDFIFWLRQTRNDLARPAAAISAVASAASRALRNDGDCLFARMSGSGSCGFGIFITLAAAERAAERISTANPGWWVHATMTGAS